MPVELDSVLSDEAVPTRADVVVVGGGIIGVCAAYFLAERNVSTLVCEKGVVAGEQSGRNWGWCRTTERDLRELPLAIESLKLWRTMNSRVGAETGFRQIGTLHICSDEATLAQYADWRGHARAQGLDTCVLRRNEIIDLVQGAGERWYGGLYTASDGVAEPRMAGPAIATAARQQGAKIVINCAARGIELNAGRIAAVMTEKGRVACEAVVVAGGVWSSLFCRSIGVSVPQLRTLGTVFRTGRVDGGPSVAVGAPDVSLRKRLDGGYTVSYGDIISEIVPDSFRYFGQFFPVLRSEWNRLSLRFGKSFFEQWQMSRPWQNDAKSPFEAVRVLDPTPDRKSLEKALANLETIFPVFKGAPVEGSWAGYIDVTPDVIPIISAVEAIPGLYLSTGYSGHGFGIGPGAGHLTADLVTGANPIVDPTPYRFSRFSAGDRQNGDRHPR